MISPIAPRGGNKGNWNEGELLRFVCDPCEEVLSPVPIHVVDFDGRGRQPYFVPAIDFPVSCYARNCCFDSIGFHHCLD